MGLLHLANDSVIEGARLAKPVVKAGLHLADDVNETTDHELDRHIVGAEFLVARAGVCGGVVGSIRHFRAPVGCDSATVEATGGGVIPPPSVSAGASHLTGGPDD